LEGRRAEGEIHFVQIAKSSGDGAVRGGLEERGGILSTPKGGGSQTSKISREEPKD